MTEQEWLECDHVDGMLRLVESDRKLRLFGVACCREVWNLIIDVHSREAVLVAERFADGLASREELEVVKRAALEAVVGADTVSVAAWKVALDAALDAALNVAWNVASDVAWNASGGGDRDATWNAVRRTQTEILRDIVHPFWDGVISANNSIVGLAATIYEDRDYSLMPILGDALEDAGCTDVSVLGHCRSGKRHFRGCWVVDKILGRE